MGTEMVALINGSGMIPGIKLDKGYDKSGLPNTDSGPLGHPETWTKGLDDLDKRLPSDLAIMECVHSLSRYAAVCQRNGLCPIVDPEIVPNGKHDIEVCKAVTERVLIAQIASLEQHGVYLEGAVLKPNMVKPGLEGTI